MNPDFSEYFYLDSTSHSGIRWKKRNGRMAPGEKAGTLYKTKKHYVVQLLRKDYNCDYIIEKLKESKKLPHLSLNNN
jgi:hypothetical protein